jgi:hypothetical protein
MPLEWGGVTFQSHDPLDRSFSNVDRPDSNDTVFPGARDLLGTLSPFPLGDESRIWPLTHLA